MKKDYTSWDECVSLREVKVRILSICSYLSDKLIFFLVSTNYKTVSVISLQEGVDPGVYERGLIVAYKAHKTFC